MNDDISDFIVVNIYCDRFPNIKHKEYITNTDQTLDELVSNFIKKYDDGLYYTDYCVYYYDDFNNLENPNPIPNYALVDLLSNYKLFLRIF